MSSLVTPEYIADFAVTAGANHTTLNGSYTAASGSMTVTSAAALSTTNQFHFYIADQTTFAVKCIGKATAVSSNTFTVTMSLDANANSGDLVYISLCAGAFRQLQADATSYGTFANLPATVPPAGAVYKGTDCPYEWFSNGSVWQAFWNGYPVTLPPSSGWTAEGVASQSGSTAGVSSFTNGFGYLIGNGLGNNSVGVQYAAAPGSTPYSFTARMIQDASGMVGILQQNSGSPGWSSNTGFAIGWRDSGGKYLIMTLCAQVSGTPFFDIIYMNSSTSLNAVVTNNTNVAAYALIAAQRDLAWKIKNDGTNLLFYVSINGGNNFYLFHSEAIATHIADATSVCWGVFKSSGSAAVCLFDWTQGT